MKLMYVYPDKLGSNGSLLDAGPPAEIAQAIEVAGFDGIAFTEHPAPSARWLENGGHQTLDPFVVLGHIAAVTSRIKLLTYLAVAPYRNPMLLAKTAATVASLSNGRFILGIGAGYLKAEFRALGVDFDERNTLIDELLEVLPMHWSGESFSYEGSHFSAREVLALPAPPGGSVPIWIGGNSPLTLRRIAAGGQGWMPLTGSPELFATTRTSPLQEGDQLAAAISDLRASAGDRGGSIDVLLSYDSPSIYDEDADLSGHREAFERYADMGVDWLAINGGPYERDGALAFIERFGKACIA